MITGSICLSDIPKDKIVTAKNGKKYLNIVISERYKPSEFGDTHSIYVSQSQEEREAKVNKSYVGRARASGQSPNNNKQQGDNSNNNGNDMPF